ncbi:hypothetical protein [Sporosarcina sp.]|uniref:hypothetical protein n=1 Tax=Sporosarcina sp. TaxID=49982 RepID=UPI0026038A07|nr:hypothetical protein [Sporosarcina sp.]
MSLSYLRQMKERRRNKITLSDNDENTIINYNVLKKEDYSIQEKIKNRNSWLLVFVGVMFTVLIFAVVFYRFIINNESTNIDTATILTTLLAFFSIYLAATFYFKATEQSNQFYDRSFSHTRDIAKTLSAMEGKFGEALRNIENYSDRINKRFDNLPLATAGTQNDILKKVDENMNELIQKMKAGEVSREELQRYEKIFSDLQRENESLKKKIHTRKLMKASSVNYLLATIWTLDLVNNGEIDYSVLTKTIQEDLAEGNISKTILDNLFETEMIDEFGNITDTGKNILRNRVNLK